MGTVLFPGGVTVGFIQINDKSEDAAQSLPLSTCSINVFSSLWVNGEKKKKGSEMNKNVCFPFNPALPKADRDVCRLRR